MDSPGFIRWLGHGTLQLVSGRGTSLLIDPWLAENPSTPDELRRVDKVDAILVTHGHFDHITDVPTLAKAHECQVIANTEIVFFLQSRQVERCTEMNKGGSVEVAELTVTMVSADHSSGCYVGEGREHREGGSAVGFVIRSPDFKPVYVSGDTGVFGDMRLIGELYRPELAAVPIDGRMNMGPFEAAMALELVGAQRALPYHWGTFPILTGTPAALRTELDRRGVGCRVMDVAPGGEVALVAATPEVAAL